MKIRIDLSENISEDEVTIKCREINRTVQKIQQYISDISSSKSAIIYYKGKQEFYFSFEDILFFETERENVYAHTADDAYRVKFRLYELEDILHVWYGIDNLGFFIGKPEYENTKVLLRNSLKNCGMKKLKRL